MPRDTPNRCLLRLREFQAIARKHGGQCLSHEYVQRQTPMAFVCRVGHVWKARPASILAGSWCPGCAHVPANGLAGVQAIARERGGRCLSPIYVAARPGMQWRCAEGHEWFAPPARIRKGTWCPTCAGHKTIEDMQALAAQHGGRCLSGDMAEGAYDACMDWECAQGHHFSVRWRCVAVGQWCPACRKGQGAWHRAHEVAKALGGACLVDIAHPTHESVGWRCAGGHEFTNMAYRVARGAWCQRCRGRRFGIEDMRAIAAERGGRCISRKFVDVKTQLRWECEAGHRWWMTPETVRQRGVWCPECRPVRPRKRPEAPLWQAALERAAASGNVCIEGLDRRAKRSVLWRCAAGHEWNASPERVAAGASCPRCSGRRLGIEHMHAMAAERGGRCVSEKFIDAYTKLQWECEGGHRWWAKPTVVRCAGTWCPHCAWDRNADRMRSEGKDLR